MHVFNFRQTVSKKKAKKLHDSLTISLRINKTQQEKPVEDTFEDT